jgi:STAS domain
MRDARDSLTTVVVVIDDGTEVVVGRMDACRPDLALVAVLARLNMEARRNGWSLRVLDAPPALRGLVELCGLSGVLALEARRQPELGEELGVDEVVKPADPPL